MMGNQKNQTDEDYVIKVVNGVNYAVNFIAVAMQILVRFSEFVMHDQKKPSGFPSACYTVIQENDVASKEPDSNPLVLSTTAIASATVSRNASGPRRSTIPAIVNVFRGPGRRCVINNPTPRF